MAPGFFFLVGVGWVIVSVGFSWWWWPTGASSSSARGWAGSALKTWVRSAAEVSWNPWIVVSDDVVIGSVGIFGGDAEPTVAFIKVAGFVDILPILDILAVVGSARAAGAGSLLELIGTFEGFEWAFEIH